MSTSMVGRTLLVMSPSLSHDERIELIVSIMYDWAVIMPIFVIWGVLPYGRYNTTSAVFSVNAQLAWALQESPSFFIPLFVLIRSDYSVSSFPGVILLSMFIFHYGYRTLVYGCKIQGGKPTPALFMSLALLFIAANGYMQATYLLQIAQYPSNWFTTWNFVVGSMLFVFGFCTHVRCDNILRSLRKPGETGYKIPRGWMFDYVTGGNYFGEIVEWIGWALACWSVPAFAFALFATAFVSSRSYVHHKWYLDRFPSYPKDRKIVFPFIF